MDLEFNDEQNMLRDMVRGVCDQYATLATLRTLEDDPTGYSPELWAKLGELGVLGLTLPEAYGGAGQSAIEGVVVYEEFGRSLAPSPHFVSCVASAGAILRAGSDEQKKAWLPKIASGEVILTPAWLEPDRGYGPKGVALRAKADGGSLVLDGTKRHVQFASSATRLLVLVRTGDAPDAIDLVLVDPKAPGVTLTQQKTLGSDCQYQVTFSNVRVSTADRIGAAGSGWKTWSDTLLEGIIYLAAQAAGGAERALEMTNHYAKIREQFGKPIGAFMAIAHYLADCATLVSGGRTLVYEAAWARATGRPIERLAPMAKLFACQMFRDVTAKAEQVHGGIGFTIEHDIQLFFRRAKHWQLSWWDTRYLEELVASTVLDAPTPCIV
ncbi:MAG: acyl-CoA/acyl-ACP dehydrogenase [Deltaproteobacteria bacterium]|nr:acyl-CoA/acyl-ACP dehydrogenase [Deltaproteobacteria bacterium]